MPWSAPSPYRAPPAYTGTWSPGLRPATCSPSLLGHRPPAHVYTAMPTPPPAPPGPLLGYFNMMAPYAPYAYSPLSSLPYAPMHVPESSSTSSHPDWDQAAFIAVMNASRSSVEAEYRVVAHAVAEAVWLHQLLAELH
jgi:hypothetical protein